MSSSVGSRSPPLRVVILGGGFAGLNVAKGLRRAQVSIVLVDRQNYHTFQPLLYQVATADLEPDNIAAPIRKILRSQPNVKVALGNVSAIDLDAKVVSFAGGELPYDVLVVATGVQQSYFGNDGFNRSHQA